MVKLICHHCDHSWDYQGKTKYYATCPNCRYKVRIQPEEPSKPEIKRRDLDPQKILAKETKAKKLIGIAAIVSRVVEKYQHDKSMLIQILLQLQNNFEWLPREMLTEVSKQLEIPINRVYQIATFYKAFSLAPRGRHLIRVCMGTSCKVRGSDRILDQIRKTLGIEKGENTPDNRFTLETVNCLGCCALGPVITIDDEYHGDLKTADLEKILSKYS
jgi:NADH-quinone oxidoreductase subunit E